MADLTLFINWDAEHDVVRLYSNVKDAAVEEVLSAFLLDLMGRGSDQNVIQAKRFLHVGITYHLSEDSFGFFHNCDNLSLMAGLVMSTIGRQVRGDVDNERLHQLNGTGGLSDLVLAAIPQIDLWAGI